MVADEFALELARRHTPERSTVLDPFCGSGRLLAAADGAVTRVGVDANPLAWLLTSAKLANPGADLIRSLVTDLASARRGAPANPGFGAIGSRRVEWFAPSILVELGRIVGWINALGLREPERWLVASALSATVREVSHARQLGWKLHRRPPEDRSSPSANPWERLERRLRYCEAELRGSPAIKGQHLVILGDAAALKAAEHPARSLGPYDVVLTSPPYGNSKTTVQYGAASALCLSIVGLIDGLGHLAAAGCEIDGSCLGGHRRPDPQAVDLRPYWAGAKGGRYSGDVRRFLSDYGEACDAIAANVKPDGVAVLVVGRRSTGGFRLRLDDFTVDRFVSLGYELTSIETRGLRQKRVPLRINRFARSASLEARERGSVATMAKEIILVLRNKGRRQTI